MKKINNKKSQVTVFIILAILILVVIGIYFIVKTDVLDLVVVNQEVQPVYSFVENCIDKTSEDAIYHIGDTGGYFILPELSSETGVAFYFYENKNYMPSKEQVEIEISEYVDEMLFFCTRNFADFPDFDVKQGEIKTQTTIQDDKVILKINYPLSISKGDNSYSFDDFEKEIPVRLGIIYDFIYETLKEQSDYPMDICISCISDLASEKDLFVSMWDYKDSVIFEVYDYQNKINEDDFVFYFANKYKTNE